MKQYNKINNLVGWLAFAVAAFTYCMTIEPTASFWDCPEFITTGYKLEVGHPPGAPFFMLTANLFSLVQHLLLQQAEAFFSPFRKQVGNGFMHTFLDIPVEVDKL